jgi:hypothetical protein
MKRVVNLAVLAVCIVALSGCGREPTPLNTVSSNTIGQELVDLKKAFDSNVITEKEYQAQRKAILDQNK